MNEILKKVFNAYVESFGLLHEVQHADFVFTVYESEQYVSLFVEESALTEFDAKVLLSTFQKSITKELQVFDNRFPTQNVVAEQVIVKAPTFWEKIKHKISS